ncbi:Ubiquitin carboxyl-terminal hydrolase 14 [Platanthera zijinensis]|uniref:Ubiquitin carboxyl-terminal hydrolase 14 n=1 Tax=Platanthera zijinensis TaxID=2320716 RepID=A0AAP0BPA0_9ASPA
MFERIISLLLREIDPVTFKLSKGTPVHHLKKISLASIQRWELKLKNSKQLAKELAASTSEVRTPSPSSHQVAKPYESSPPPSTQATPSPSPRKASTAPETIPLTEEDEPKPEEVEAPLRNLDFSLPRFVDEEVDTVSHTVRAQISVAAADLVPANPTNLEQDTNIGVEGGFDNQEPIYEETRHIFILPYYIALPFPSAELLEKVRLFVDAIFLYEGVERKYQLASWATEKKKRDYALLLE